jgi:hypothetical protein
MSGIIAIKSSICRTTNLRKGSGISRLYHNSKIISRRCNTMAGVDALLAFMGAHNKSWFLTILLTLTMWSLAKKGEEFRNIKLELQEYYQPIVDRAKKIYKR